MKIFKVNIFIFIFILVISIPLGFYIYKYNLSKVNLVLIIDSGKLISTNYCQNYTDLPNRAILGSYQLDQIKDKLRSNIVGAAPDYKGKVDATFNTDQLFYRIELGGFDQNLKIFKDQIPVALKLLEDAEKKMVGEKYSKLIIHCYGDSYPAFTYIASDGVEPKALEISVYSRFHILFSAISPFIILYLLTIIYGFIKSNFGAIKKRM